VSTTDKPVPRWAGVATLLLIAVVFGSNHVAARLAFDHGAGVTTAVAIRSSVTALAVLSLLLLARVPLRMPAPTLRRGLAIGLLMSAQSYCLYSAVARIPVALALLAFNTFPVVLALLSWASGAERPLPRTLVAMPVALAGLAMALDVFGWAPADAQSGGFTRMWPGVAFALGASVSFATALLLTTRWLGDVDGRLRTFLLMSVIAVVTLAVSVIGDGFRLPTDATGWLGLGLLTLLYGTAITTLFVVLPRLGAVNNAAVLNVEPLAALAMAWLVLDQRIAFSQIAGGVVVIVAIVVLTTGKR
jgi:drug/metabolite transporter (DMT)-like permease